MLTAREPPAVRPTRPLGQGRGPHVVEPEDRLSGAELWDPPLTGKGASCTSGGRSEVAGGVRKGRSDNPGRHERPFGSSRHGYSDLHGTGRTRRSSRELTMATSESSWPARPPATHTEAQAGTSGPRERKSDPSGRGPSGRSNQEATSNQKTSHGTESEATWAWSD
jgi:hypothetical protein